MPLPDYRALLWLDTETTGLNYGCANCDTGDLILEVAWTLTDLDLNIHAQGRAITGTFDTALPALGASHPAVVDMHIRNGLIRELVEIASSPQEVRHMAWTPIDQVDRDLANALASAYALHEVALAGSGVGHFDSPFMERWMPLTRGYLHPSPLDIGTIRRAVRMWAPGWIPDDNTSKPHRALDDVAIHLADARQIRERFQAAGVLHDAGVKVASGLPPEATGDGSGEMLPPLVMWRPEDFLTTDSLDEAAHTPPRDIRATTQPQQFTKRPVTIEAMQWDGTAEGATPIIDWVLTNGGTATYRGEIPGQWRLGEPGGPTTPPIPACLRVVTIEGTMAARSGWWIIRGVAGEFYPCEPAIFEQTYMAGASLNGVLDSLTDEAYLGSHDQSRLNPSLVQILDDIGSIEYEEREERPMPCCGITPCAVLREDEDRQGFCAAADHNGDEHG